jgi:hypothetical protein
MSDVQRQSTFQIVAMAYFPMFIATLSLLTSIYNGYLNGRFVDLIRHNTGRIESLRTCKETIEAYFQVKFLAGITSSNAERAGAARADGGRMRQDQIEAINAVSKFAALGTYLANLRDDDTRVHYTKVSQELEKIVEQAAHTPRAQLDKLFANADHMFAAMNDDCVKTARTPL